MPLNRQSYTVALDTPDGRVEHVVDVGPGDQLRAELEGKRRGLLPKGISGNPLVFSSLCVYYACVRAGHTDTDFERFIHTDCYDYEPLDEGQPLDPTSPEGPSPSGSLSPAPSVTPASGSTPS